MPADPQQLAQLVGSPEFQALGVPDQLAAFRSHLNATDEEFNAMPLVQQMDVSQQVLEHYQPGFASKLADIGEYVPVIGGAIQGARETQLRPLTSLAVGGYEPTTALGRSFLEAGRDVGELAAVGGVESFARPLFEKIAARVGGSLAEDAITSGLAKLVGRTGATEAVDQALAAGTSQLAEKAAGMAAKTALRERYIAHGLSALTAGELFGVSNAIERGIAGGEPEPLEDFVKTPLGVAALGIPFMGAGEVARRLGLRSIQPIVDDLAARDPERFQRYQGDAARMVDAVRKSSEGRLTNEGAGDVVFNAVTGPLAAAGDVKVLRSALRNFPEVLDTELGQHVLRTQRARVLEPETRVTTSPGLRVTYDDENARTVTEVLNSAAEQKRFAERVSAGRVVVDNAAGDERSLLRAGIHPGTEVESLRGPGGGLAIGPEGAARSPVNVAGPFAKDLGIASYVPAIRPETAGLSEELDRAVAAMRPEPLVTRSAADLAASPEAFNRLAGEQRRGERVVRVNARSGAMEDLPPTVDRVNIQPRKNELFARIDAQGKVSIDRAHEDLKPGLQQLALQRVARAVREQRMLPAPTGEVIDLNGRDVVLVPPDAQPVAPPPGTTVRTAQGSQVRVVGTMDALNRVPVEHENGQRVLAKVRGNVVHAYESLFDALPQRAAANIERTRFIEPEIARMRSQELDAQIRPGQVIHQTTIDMERRGVRPSVEVLAREGDRVLVRSGDEVRDVPLAQVNETINNRVGRFAFDMTQRGEDRVGLDAERFNSYFRGGNFVGDPMASPAALARDVQLADELFAFDKQAGQKVGPATLGRDAGDGLAEQAAKRENLPAEDRTKGNSRLVKGCKP